MPVSVSTSPSIELVRDAIEQTIETWQHRLAEGSAGDYPEYRYQVGYLRGLETALEAMRPKDVKVEKVA